MMGLGNWIVGALRLGEYREAVEGLERLEPAAGLGPAAQVDPGRRPEGRRAEVVQEKYRFYLTVVLWGRSLVLAGMMTILVSLLAALKVWGGVERGRKYNLPS